MADNATGIDDVFTPAKKAIFRYADGGGKTLAADPLVIRGMLNMKAMERGKSLDDLIKAANGVDLAKATPEQTAENWVALMMLADVSREAFNLVPFNKETGDGADTDHALAVLDHFHVWCEKKNQQPVSPPTSMPLSESTSAIPPTTATSSV